MWNSPDERRCHLHRGGNQKIGQLTEIHRDFKTGDGPRYVRVTCAAPDTEGGSDDGQQGDGNMSRDTHDWGFPVGRAFFFRGSVNAEVLCRNNNYVVLRFNQF
jgi:hypothetical protein